MDKLTSMKVFAAVAKHGSFTAAADELGISRAMASKHINQLEDNLGVRLLNRTTRHLSLTDVGMAYRDRVNVILSEIEEAELSASQLQMEPRGILKISSPPSFGSFHLARVISAYKEQFPHVIIDLILTYSTPDLVEEGVDISIHLGEPEDSSFVARPLASSRRVICGSPEYFERHGKPQTPDQLKQHNCLCIEDSLPFSDWRLNIDGQETLLNVEGNFKSNVADPLRIAAIRGCGLVQLPSYMVGLDIQSGRLTPVLAEYEPAGLPIYAIYPHRKHLSAKVRTFFDFMQEHFQTPPYWDEWIYEK